MNIELNVRAHHLDPDRLDIPGWVTNLATFRSWVQSGALGDKVRIAYLHGRLWIDMSMEQYFSNNQVKSEFGNTLGPLAKREKLGRYSPDGMLLTNEEADLSCQPDGIFVAHESFRNGRVQLVEGAKEGYVELLGSPDMVLEIISSSSVEKDSVTLRELYWRAGIREYWLVDARADEVRFRILRHTPKRYVAVRPQKGWLKSTVFGRSFHLVRIIDVDGNPDFTLEMRR